MDPSTTTLPPPQLKELCNILENGPEAIAAGNSTIQSTALGATKYLFDLSLKSEETSQPYMADLLSSLTNSFAPQTRSKSTTTIPVQSPAPLAKAFEPTPLQSLFVDDVEEDQIWAQLDLRTKRICEMLDFVLEGETADPTLDQSDESAEEGNDDKLKEALAALQNGEDVDMDEFLAKYGDDEDLSEDLDDEMDDDEASDFDDGSDELDEEAEAFTPLREPLSEEDESEDERERETIPLSSKAKKQKNKRHSPLDDNFFNLAEFNADTERAEARKSSRGRLSGDDSDDEEDMDIDLFAAVDDSEEVDDSKELFYRDFFEPPSNQKPAKPKSSSQVRFHDQVRVKKVKARGKNLPLNEDSDEEEEEDHDENDFGEGISGSLDEFEGDEDEDEDEDEAEAGETHLQEDEDEESMASDDVSSEQSDDYAKMERFKDDLFADEDDNVQDDLTTHERRQLALKEEIAELESQNVAKKDWMLIGEAGSRQRPQNSLLEEDLEFDRVMKSVPVITEEVVQGLEEIIKTRIKENRFDDVVRVRPFEEKPFLPSRMFELQDTKSKQSLAQIYEDEYMSQQAGTTTDDRDGKLQKEHNEITNLWENICSKLDALSNAHFVPKQPKATITTVSDVPTATIESALPTSKSSGSMLAPEEVYATKSATARARSELTPAEKRTQRTKERKLRKRQRDSLDKSVDKFAKVRGISGVKKQKKAALDSVVKAGKGVTIIGKEHAKNKRQK
ncbi:hypothetical protein CVT24_011581 [Panaeolus cyanescens]|uniref:U3 small nucleolar ribonucleoprotein protein MPP10 n=1 Tax=Panaeolus cyanescens TaxID=181874 RepID=A0A409YV48_9AGAR|nr:hypothetical protein CVT24_011581 [Panaeolus cyanescens]